MVVLVTVRTRLATLLNHINKYAIICCSCRHVIADRWLVVPPGIFCRFLAENEPANTKHVESMRSNRFTITRCCRFHSTETDAIIAQLRRDTLGADKQQHYILSGRLAVLCTAKRISSSDCYTLT